MFPALVAIASFTLMLATSVATAASSCPWGNKPSELFRGDTYVSHALIGRNTSGKFATTDYRTGEIALYLDTLRLPSYATKAYVVFRKTLVEYDPTRPDHWGKPWYAHNGQLVDKSGDKNILTNQNFNSKYYEVRKEMINFQAKNHWGPFVPYENEDKGKDVVEVDIVLSDANDCWLDRLTVTAYRLPEKNAVPVLDNVDAGNYSAGGVLVGCGTTRYAALGGGSGPRYPENQRDRRGEWENGQKERLTEGSGSNIITSANAVILGRPIVYSSVGFYPHLQVPIVAVTPSTHRSGYELSVKLPKYFSGARIPAFYRLECVQGGKMSVSITRGAATIEQVVPISGDMKDAIDFLK